MRAGCAVPPEASLAFVGIFRSFAKPPNDAPFHIQKLVIVEGDAPKAGCEAAASSVMSSLNKIQAERERVRGAE